MDVILSGVTTKAIKAVQKSKGINIGGWGSGGKDIPGQPKPSPTQNVYYSEASENPNKLSIQSTKYNISISPYFTSKEGISSLLTKQPSTARDIVTGKHPPDNEAHLLLPYTVNPQPIATSDIIITSPQTFTPSGIPNPTIPDKIYKKGDVINEEHRNRAEVIGNYKYAGFVEYKVTSKELVEGEWGDVEKCMRAPLKDMESDIRNTANKKDKKNNPGDYIINEINNIVNELNSGLVRTTAKKTQTNFVSTPAPKTHTVDDEIKTIKQYGEKINGGYKYNGQNFTNEQLGIKD